MIIHFRHAASLLLEWQIIICAIVIIVIASLLGILQLLAKLPSTEQKVRRLRARGREVDALRSLFSSIIPVACPRSRGQLEACLLILRSGRRLLTLVDTRSSPLTDVQAQVVDELGAALDDLFRLALQTSGPGSDGWPAVQQRWSAAHARASDARKAILHSLRSG